MCLHAVLLLCIVFWTGSCLVWAQAGAEGTMTGNVTDPSGAPIPDATVTIRNIDRMIDVFHETGTNRCVFGDKLARRELSA